ncbi:MAG TPA: ribosome maturation factor RimM [Candidatus Saccharimonadales bacterium]|nr:ribosome maturation factor RimM [Candidatus Saccharimonadales bacterium]
MTQESGNAAFVTIARVAKVQGRVGEVLAELYTDFPERFEQRRTLYAWHEGTEQRRELHLEEYWPHKGGMVFKFEGVDSIEEAEKLLRSEIQIPATERAELEEGAFYVSDLLGCLVVEVSQAERTVGTVVDVNFGAGTAPLLIVNNESGKEFMIPFVESFTKKLDTKAKRIEMQLPEGMLELDAPLSAGKKVQ